MQYGVLLLLCGLGYFGGSIGRYKFNVTFGETLFSEFYRLGCLQVIYLCYFKATPRRGTETIVFLPSSRGRIANGWKKKQQQEQSLQPPPCNFQVDSSSLSELWCTVISLSVLHWSIQLTHWGLHASGFTTLYLIVGTLLEFLIQKKSKFGQTYVLHGSFPLFDQVMFPKCQTCLEKGSSIPWSLESWLVSFLTHQ